MTLLIGLDSLFDEESRGADSAFRSSLYKVQPNFISLGEISSAIDRDYYELQVIAGNAYTITMTSDAFNYG